MRSRHKVTRAEYVLLLATFLAIMQVRAVGFPGRFWWRLWLQGAPAGRAPDFLCWLLLNTCH